jgi:hypothetical protein
MILAPAAVAFLMSGHSFKPGADKKSKRIKQKNEGQKNERNRWLFSFFCPSFFCFLLLVMKVISQRPSSPD